MWYLSRSPSSVANAKPHDQNSHDHSISTITLHDSVFPASDSGLFHDICIVEIPMNPNTNNVSKKRQTYPCSSWEWFAYLFSPTQFHSVVVPRALASESAFRIQVIGVFPQHFLCAKVLQGPLPYASLCTYSCSGNSVHDVPQMKCEDRNLVGAACALLDGCLYVAGGFKGNSSSNIDPSSHLNSAERLNLETWKWESLPDMQKPRAFATGFTHKKRFFVVGGSENVKHSAEIYNPNSNSWICLKSFVPKEAEGYTAASLNGRLMILTWSDQLGVKLWLWTVLANPNLVCRCRLVSFFPNQIVERPRLKAVGARMVQVGGMEVWVLVGENERFWVQIDGSSAWPVFPAPEFRPSGGHQVVHKGYNYAFSFKDGIRVSWRKIPVYSI